MGHLFSVPKPKMNFTKWDTLLFEASPADPFITFQGKSGAFLQKLGIIKPMSLIMNKSAKECEGEEEKEEIHLSKALEMADKLKMYCLRKRIHNAHPQVPSIRNNR